MFFVPVHLVGLQLNSGIQVICLYFGILLLLFLFLLIIINYNKVNKKIVYTEIPIPKCRYCSQSPGKSHFTDSLLLD